MTDESALNDFDEIGDNVKVELDRRKLKKLVDDGVINAEELANAPIYVVKPVCKCNKGLLDDPMTRKLICPECRQEGVSELEPSDD